MLQGGLTGVCHHTINSEAERMKQARTERVRFMYREELLPRVVARQLVIELVRRDHVSAVEHVSPRERIRGSQFMVHARREVVSWRDLLPRGDVDAGVTSSQKAGIRKRIERTEKTQHFRIHGNGSGRQSTRASRGGGHSRYIGHALRLAYPLVVAEDKSAVLDDRSPYGGSKLIPAEGRLLLVEIVRCIQSIVTQVFENAAVELIRA